MPVRLLPVASKENKTVKETLLCNHINKKNNVTGSISAIENNTITMENKSPSPSWSINVFFSNIKYQFLKHSSPQPTADIELDNILSQGRILSDDADTVHTSLNNEADITPSCSLSLTTKTGIALGGLLLSSAMLGGGIYYMKRTSREPYSDMPDNTSNRSLPSTSLIPPDTHRHLNSHPTPALLPESITVQDDSFRTSEFKNKQKRHNSFPCPYTHKNKKNQPSLTYTYTKKQSTVCLTKSFNQRCQRGHRQSKAGKDCHYIPPQMVLKIKGYLCYCPPPDWIAMKIIEPKYKKKTTQKKKPPVILPLNPVTPSTTPLTTSTGLPKMNPPPRIHSSSQDEMVKDRLFDSYAYFLPPEKIDTVSTNINSTDSNESEVKRISLVECANERANMTLSKTLRIISQTMNSPVATFLREGAVVIQYEFLDEKCADNTLFYETVKKIESTVESILSWIPRLNKFYFTVKVISSLLETYSDALDGNDFNMNNIEDLNSRLLGLSKDIFSSISTKDIYHLSRNPNMEGVKELISSLAYKKNNLMINIGKNKNKVKVKAQKKFNHLADSEKNDFIFYDYEKKWNIDSDIKLNSHVKAVFEESKKTWPDSENIFFFKNSSPEFYGNGVIIQYNKDLHTLIDHQFYKVDEIKLTDTVFRYVTKDINRPIIYKGERWGFEESSSYSVSQELEKFLSDNHKTRNNLVSKNIGHQDVSPLTPARDIQFDKNFNEYIKINNQYYKIKKYYDTSHYIEGSHDIVALQLIDNKYYLKKSLLDDICCFHRESLDTIKEIPNSDKFFLDNTVISYLNDIHSEAKSQDKVIIKDISGNHVAYSKEIDGAILFDGVNYIKYNNNLIQIHSNGDDTYTLGDREDSKSNILIYKNQASNTYFKMPIRRNKWQGLIKKASRCRVKKQPMAACNIAYFESHRLSYLL